MAVVVLIGMPGSGKTSVGRALAERLHVDFVDTDALVESREGSSPASLIRERGESYFREREADALESVVDQPAVIATGGGIVTTPRATRLLSDQTCVYLHASLDTLVLRVGDADRPLLLEDAESSLRRLLGERDGQYQELATIRVDATMSVDAIVDQICASMPEERS